MPEAKARPAPVPGLAPPVSPSSVSPASCWSLSANPFISSRTSRSGRSERSWQARRGLLVRECSNYAGLEAGADEREVDVEDDASVFVDLSDKAD